MLTTHNISLPLLKEYQTKKDYTLNKTISLIDGLLNKAVDTRVERFDRKKHHNLSFVIQSCDNSLLIKIDDQWHVFYAQKGMIFFILNVKKWCYFDGANWNYTSN